MKPSTDKSLPASPIAARTTPATLYQIFRQTRAGAFVPSFQSDSPVISVESFLRQSPAFDCCEVSRWDQRYRRVIAAVRSTHTKTAFGFHVLQREDVFYDRRFAELTREVHVQEFLSAPKWLDPAMA
jgi:hypothetical protein